MYRSVIALLFLAAATIDATAQNLPVPSYWLNQHGSNMKLYRLHADGRFKGLFFNHWAGTHCQNTPYDLRGRVIGRRVAFAVRWQNWAEDCHSKTFWHGHLVGATLKTRWLLITRAPDGTVSETRGRDNFQLQP